MPRCRGFTTVEIILVLVCLGLLVGILTPLVVQNMEDARISEARREIKTIRQALIQFHADMGRWPTRSDQGEEDWLHILYTAEEGSGPIIPPGAYLTGELDRRDHLEDHLIKNRQGYHGWTGQGGWNGPYLAHCGLDPWGSSYLIYVLGFWLPGQEPATEFTEAWILSAGPDGILHTFASDEVIASDDIGVRLR